MPNHLEGNPLWREPGLRTKQATELIADGAHRVLTVVGSHVAICDDARACFLEGETARHALEAAEEPVLLGSDRGTMYWCVADGAGGPSPSGGSPAPDGRAAPWSDLKHVASILPAGEAAILATARAFARFHTEHRYCAHCGGATTSVELGAARRCREPTCSRIVFPRTDPAVIMLPVKGERCLMVRQAGWPPGRFAAVAGFVEPGESLEDAVRREILEETALSTSAVRYHSSQPWPFPGSIMIGFYAAVDGSLRLDPVELEDAAWFDRRELLEAVEEGRVLLPTRVSIAYRLVSDWLDAALPRR